MTIANFIDLVIALVKGQKLNDYLRFQLEEYDRASASQHSYLWNAFLVKNDAPYRFAKGNNSNTISFHLKQCRGYFRRFGKVVANMLNVVDNRHLENTTMKQDDKIIRLQ